MSGPRIRCNFVLPPTRVPARLLIHFEQHKIVEAAFVEAPGGTESGDATTDDHHRLLLYAPHRRKRSVIAQLMAELKGIINERSGDRAIAFDRQSHQRRAAGSEKLPARHPQWLISFQS